MTALIHIIDDDAAVRSALSLLVRSYGWLPQEHKSAESFLASDGANSCDSVCLLLDLDMPGMNGAELCEHLRVRGPAIPIIVITANQDHPLARRALAAGAQAIVPKPVDDEVLLTMVTQFVN